MARARTRASLRRALIGAGATLALLIGVVVTTAHAATLFSDDFEDGNTTGWTQSGGSWSVATDGSRVLRQASTSSDARNLAGSSGWTNVSVQARAKALSFNGSDRFFAILARAQGATSYYYLALRSSNRVELKKLVGGSSTLLAAAGFAVTTGTFYTVRLDVAGTTLRGFVNNTQLVTASDSQFSAGRAGVATFNTSAEFDDVVVSDSAPPASTTTTTTSPGSSTTTSTTIPPPPPRGLVGFASVNALGQNGTTGGAGGPTVTVSSATDFLAAIAQPGPLVIRVSGMLILPGPMHDVTSDKSILGVGPNSGITGAGLNIGDPISDSTTPPPNPVHNVIIRNMVFRNAADDSINVQMFAHHVWIDHNDLAGGFDGLIDIKRGSSYVTVSWNHTHDHTKNMLLGHDDSNGAQDIGRLKVTYHHNWFDETPQRNPRVRFGEPVHVFNNYYFHNTDVGVACQANGGCMVEGNYFEDVEEPMSIHYAGPTGRMVERSNVFVGDTGAPDVGGIVQEPSAYYSYTLDTPGNVKAIVTAGAGVGKIGL